MHLFEIDQSPVVAHPVPVGSPPVHSRSLRAALFGHRSRDHAQRRVDDPSHVRSLAYVLEIVGYDAHQPDTHGDRWIEPLVDHAVEVGVA